MRRQRQRVWFERWIREGYGVRQLSQQSGQPSMRLRRIIDYWLMHPPAVSPDLSRYRHLIVDATYLCGRRWPLTVFMDALANSVVAGELGVHEAASAMGLFCAHLARQGLNPFSITTDGQPRLLEALRQCWPQTILQRCLVHIQRQGLMWCRRRPTRTDAQHLRRLFLQLTAIRTPVARDRWIACFASWEQRYGWKIDLTPGHGWVFSDLKRARSLIVNALPDMFHYLTYPGIPNTTNGLEGYFSRLKMRYRQHRGLHPQRRHAYIRWYLHLCGR